MTLFKEGFSQLIDNFTYKKENNETKSFSARVIDIILNENHPKFTEFGEWKSIGTIFISPINSPTGTDNIVVQAKPMFSNVKIYPIKNELVYCIYLPNIESEFNLNSIDIYYLPNINIWNNVNLNPLPNPLTNTPLNNKSYQEIEGGFNNTYNNEINYSFGKYFKEKNISPLKTYEGDILYEGRWGNSIRFSSNIPESPWFFEKNIGNPIIIISNGRKINNPSYKNTVENINEDNSSIYITSNNILPINVNSKFESIKNNKPKEYKEYFEPQITLISDRLLFISKKDSILFKSNKNIHFDADGFNIECKNTIIQSKIYLGDKNAEEPILLGNKTIELFNSLFINLKSFMDICSKLTSTPEGTPIPSLNVVSQQMSLILKELTNNLESLKSKNTFTK
jgi:hypothetical protein